MKKYQKMYAIAVFLLCCITGICLYCTDDKDNIATLGFYLNAPLVGVTTLSILIPFLKWAGTNLHRWEEKRSPMTPFRTDPSDPGPDFSDVVKDSRKLFFDFVETVKKL